MIIQTEKLRIYRGNIEDEYSEQEIQFITDTTQDVHLLNLITPESDKIFVIETDEMRQIVQYFQTLTKLDLME